MDSRSGLKGKCQNKTARGDASEKAQQISLGFLGPGKMPRAADRIDSGSNNAEPVNALDSQEPEWSRAFSKPAKALDSQEKEGKFAVE
ncbi:hypothetical protein SH501x_002326 [Pirellulaceae bacterium SH501]